MYAGFDKPSDITSVFQVLLCLGVLWAESQRTKQNIISKAQKFSLFVDFC